MKNIRINSRLLIIVMAVAAVFLSGMMAERIFKEGGPDVSITDTLMPVAMAQNPPAEELPDIVERVVPAVVYIQSKTMVQQRGADSPMMNDPFFRRFFDDFFRRYNVPREREEKYLGSGVIVSGDGYILTNNHLVANAKEVEVILPDKREFDARVIGTDPRSDVALIKIDGKDLPTLRLGDSNKLRLGQTVLAIGYPYAVGQTVTMGIVSALGRSLELVDYEDFIQTDAAINPGNSGGALINEMGELIGINTAIYSRSGGNQGIGFAIPIDLARSVMDNIIEHGRVVRGYVGVEPQDISIDMVGMLGLKDPHGVLITHVAEGSPAEEAGLERGDVIVGFNGKKVDNTSQFRRYAADSEPGKKVPVEILREGEKKTFDIKLVENPADQPASEQEETEDRNPVFLGVSIETLTNEYRQALRIPSEIRGVIVTEVDGGTPAEKAGLSRGDVIIELNRKRVSDIEDFRKIVEGSDERSALLLVYREGSFRYIAIKE